MVTLDQPPDNLRPGLSTTAKIKTASRQNVLAIPIQALAVRTRKDLEDAAKDNKSGTGSGVTLAAPPNWLTAMSLNSGTCRSIWLLPKLGSVCSFSNSSFSKRRTTWRMLKRP